MASTYLVRPLARDQVSLAYPLVSVFDVALTMEQWLAYAHALTESSDDPEGRRIVSVQSGQGHIYGVSAYWLKPDLRRGRILEIENFALVDVTGHPVRRPGAARGSGGPRQGPGLQLHGH